MKALRILAFVIFSLFVNIATAKIIISGHVINEDNEPVDVATTKIVDESGKIISFQITDDNGYFKYVFESDNLNAKLVVECLGYGTFTSSL